MHTHNFIKYKDRPCLVDYASLDSEQLNILEYSLEGMNDTVHREKVLPGLNK
jgi:hypothetical protein